MDEPKLSFSDIANALNEENYCDIPCICGECLHDVINLVLSGYDDVDFTVQRCDDGLFSLIIIVHPEEDHDE